MCIRDRDTPLADAEAQDMTFATDNFQAGLLICQWAAATLGEGAATAKIAMLDINKDNISVDVARDTGFLVGFGIEVPDLSVLASETDPRVIGHETSDANPEGGLRAMETLLAKDPDINVVYTINEPAAEGAYPVSYTHLDVYKRQGMECRSAWGSPFVDCRQFTHPLGRDGACKGRLRGDGGPVNIKSL